MASFKMQMANDDRSRERFVNYGHRCSGLWVLVAPDSDNATDSLNRIMPIRYLAANQTVLGVLPESFSQPHSSVWYCRDMPATMRITLEFHKHYEGIPDSSKSGFANHVAASLHGQRTAISVISEINPDGIFRGYAQDRDRYISLMLANEGRVMGLDFWKEPLFQRIKEMIRYGADQLLDSDLISSGTDMLVDAATASISALAPEFAPAIMMAGKAGKHLASSAIKDGVTSIRDWADTAKVKGMISEDHSAMRAKWEEALSIDRPVKNPSQPMRPVSGQLAITSGEIPQEKAIRSRGLFDNRV